MDTLLIFFAFPIAVIIFSIILENLLKCPVAVAALVFAAFIIVTFAAFDETFLIATLAYTIIAFITAFVVHLLKDKECNISNNNDRIYDLFNKLLNNCNDSNINNNNDNNNSNNEENQFNNGNLSQTVESVITNNSNNNSNNLNNCGCGCNRYRRRF